MGGAGLTQEIFSEVADDVKDEIVMIVNNFCTGSVSNAMRCCATSDTLNEYLQHLTGYVKELCTNKSKKSCQFFSSPSGKTFATSSDVELLYEELASGGGVDLLFTVDYDDTNAVCSDTAARRRKRAVLSFDQTVLEEIFANQTM